MPRVRVNEAEIEYDEFGVGTPLLLLHGMLETGRTYAQLALNYSIHFRVLVPDLRGYGRSAPKPRTFPPDFYNRDAADMAAFLAHLHLPPGPVVGFGDGGEVALLLAIAAPEQVSAVVAVDVTGAFSPALLDVLPSMGNWSEGGNTANLARRQEVIREYGLDGALAIWRDWKAAVRAIIAAGGNISLAQAGAIRCPVHIINREDDSLNTPEMSRALAAAIPDAHLLLRSANSALSQEVRRRRLSELALDWLLAQRVQEGGSPPSRPAGNAAGGMGPGPPAGQAARSAAW